MDWSKYFTYCATTGSVIRKALPMDMFASRRAYARANKMFAGKTSGHKLYRRGGQKHCIQVSLFKKEYQAHIIVWELTHGVVPKGMVIDHIDGDPFNNLISNLRLATPSQNAMNARKHKPNRSGVKGVTVEGGKYRASIRKNYKAIALGTFETLEQARAAREQGERIHHGEFAPR